MRQIYSEDLINIGLIKKGMFSYVYKAKFRKQRNEIVTVKLFKGDFRQKADYENVKNYIDSGLTELKKIQDHENIVKIIGYTELNSVVMSFEGLYIRGRWIHDLLSYLIHLREEFQRKEMGILNKNYEICHKEELHSFALGIAEGCNYLQGKCIVIGDLSAKNVLIDQNKIVKLSDFGFSPLKRYLMFKKVAKFPQNLIAPELMMNGYKFSRVSDIWSFGIVLLEIKTLGGLPFGDYSREEIIEYSQSCKPKRHIWKCTDLYIRQICFLPQSERQFYKFAFILDILKSFPCFRQNKMKCELFEMDPDLPLTFEEIQQQNLVRLHRNDHFNREKCFLGSGIFGEVQVVDFIARKSELRLEKFATKKLFIGTAEYFEEMLNKLGKLKHHRNLVQLRAYFKLEKWVMMDYESMLVDDGNIELTGLEKYLQYLRATSRKGKLINGEELEWFAVQIAKGMSHLEKIGILHGNLAARNILINNAKVVKITDYFIPIHRYSLEYFSKDNCTNGLWERWAAPEVVNCLDYSFKSDVWSFGIVLWEIATLGAYPFGQYKPHKLEGPAKEIIRPETISADCWDVMSYCWGLRAQDRPSFEKVYSVLDVLMVTERLQFNFNFDFEYASDFFGRFPTKDEFEAQNLRSSVPPAAVNKPVSTTTMQDYLMKVICQITSPSAQTDYQLFPQENESSGSLFGEPISYHHSSSSEFMTSNVVSPVYGIQRSSPSSFPSTENASFQLSTSLSPSQHFSHQTSSPIPTVTLSPRNIDYEAPPHYSFIPKEGLIYGSFMPSPLLQQYSPNSNLMSRPRFIDSTPPSPRPPIARRFNLPRFSSTPYNLLSHSDFPPLGFPSPSRPECPRQSQRFRQVNYQRPYRTPSRLFASPDSNEGSSLSQTSSFRREESELDEKDPAFDFED